jgi:predicted nucleotidyltransferase
MRQRSLSVARSGCWLLGVKEGVRPHAEAGKVDLVTAGGLRPELRQGILAETVRAA